MIQVLKNLPLILLVVSFVASCCTLGRTTPSNTKP
jgi:hypothetical protein